MDCLMLIDDEEKGETMIIECDISYVFGINSGNTILFFANILKNKTFV